MRARIQLNVLVFSEILILFYGLQNGRQFVAKEDGHDGWRSLVASQTVIISRAGGCNSHQIGVIIHTFDNRHQEYQELNVLCGRIAGV